MNTILKILGLVLLAILVVILLTQTNLLRASGVTRSDELIDLKELIEERHPAYVKVVKVQRLDVDDDGEDEWLVLYRFDPSRGPNWVGAPTLGLLYDAVSCEFPEFVTYTLPTPSNDYLAEGPVSVTLEDLELERDPYSASKELIIRGDGNRKLLAIYRFRDTVQNPCIAPREPREGLQLLGYFSSNLRIERNGAQVVVWNRTIFERSQLAIRQVYLPSGGTYMDESGRLRNPTEQGVEFAFGLPESPADSPYPEKAVVAFYLYLGVDKEKAKDFLMPQLQPQFPQGRFGLPLPVSQVGRAVVYSVSYTPDVVKERQREDREVTVTVLATPTQGGKMGGPGPCTVRWRVSNYQQPVHPTQSPTETPTAEQKQRTVGDLEWRLAEILEVSGGPLCGK